MDNIPENMQKYANYREQMTRLTKALNAQFYLEAIFIEYAIMEDRLESILRHSGTWNPKPGSFISIDKKLVKVAKLAEEKKSPAQKYFSVELTDGIREWKEERNRMIHALMKQTIHTTDLQTLAENGQQLTKTLCSKATSYNRAIAKKNQEVR